MQKVDELTDQMSQTGEIPYRHIPARPNADYDLLVGELLKRFMESKQRWRPIDEVTTDTPQFRAGGWYKGQWEVVNGFWLRDGRRYLTAGMRTKATHFYVEPAPPEEKRINEKGN